VLYKDIQWPLHADWCAVAIMLVVMMTAGCGPRKIAIAPEERLKLKEEPGITAFRYDHSAVFVLIRETDVFHTLTLEKVAVKEEPLIPLQESFLAAVKTELNLDNIRTLPEPRHHGPDYRFRLDRSIEREPDLIQIRRTFQTGLVFDFDRDIYIFEPDPFDLHPKPGGKALYRVHLWAKASLIRVNEQKILWQGVCDITDGGLTLADFRQPIKPLVQEKLDGAIKACAQELTAQFMGK